MSLHFTELNNWEDQTMPTASDTERVLSNINGKELSELVMSLVAIESPPGKEKAVADYVYEWLKKEGFDPRRVGMLPDRFNVAGILRGNSNGYRLLFNAHTDVAITRKPWEAGESMWRTGWQEANRLYGGAVMNDKGPMACYMIAAKAIKDSRVDLKGDIVLTMVCGEIGRQPLEEIVPQEHYGREVGARWLITHGPYAYADYAIVAEATGGTCTWVECGQAHFKVTIKTETPAYIPHMVRPTNLTNSQNSILRATPYIQAFDKWAAEVYEKRWSYKFSGGTVVPKADVAAISAGDPTRGAGMPGLCQLYLTFFTPPKLDPLWIERELLNLGKSINVPVEVEMYTYARGFEGIGVEPLVASIGTAHRKVFGEAMKPVPTPITSMWRDVNVFNEVGIPTVTYGPGASTGMYAEQSTMFVTVEELESIAKVYALVALDLCNREKTWKR
jgi:acetylornithine deacetylase/succinyl-diaminopimelate desuccinylase-like protein